MRITNVSTASRHFAYAGNSGRTLRSGEVSAEMPLATMLKPALKADLAANRVRLRLSDQDRATIAWILQEDARKIVVAEPIPPAPKPAAPKPAANKPVGLVPVIEKAPEEPPRAIFMEPGKARSIQDLQRHNQAVRVSNPPAGIPINHGGSAGQPDFGTNRLTGRESVQNARGILGKGLV